MMKIIQDAKQRVGTVGEITCTLYTGVDSPVYVGEATVCNCMHALDADSCQVSKYGIVEVYWTLCSISELSGV